MRWLRIILIILIVGCCGAAAMFGLQTKRIVSVAGESVEEEAAGVTEELLLLKEELAALHGQIQELETAKLAVEQERYLAVTLPEAVRQGENLLYYHSGDRKLYYVEPLYEMCRAIYTVKEPWYLLAYDLSSTGEAVWAQKMNSVYKSEQEIGIYILDLAGNSSVREVERIRPPYWLEDEDDIRVEKLAFSSDGEYIVVELAGNEWRYFNVYSVNSLANVITQSGYHEMAGAYIQQEFIDFVADNSAVLYTREDETGDFANQTLLYEDSLYYNEQGFFRLKDFEAFTFFSADGCIYAPGFKAGTTDVWLEELPETALSKEISYLYQIRNQRFKPLLPEPYAEGSVSNEAEERVIEVKSALELLQSIRPNRTIKLAPGSYNLTAVPHVDNPYVKYVPVDNQFEVVIRNVDNLKLLASGTEPAEILAEPTYANVLGFENCSNITISGIRAGHVFEGYCTGGVLQFAHCTDVRITKSLLYGSGTYGLTLQNVYRLEFTDSVITECTYGIMDVYRSADLHFLNSRFIRNKDMDMVNLNDASEAVFQNCEFRENEGISVSRLFALGNDSQVVLNNSKILNNRIDYLANRANGLELNNTELKGNNFTGKYEQ